MHRDQGQSRGAPLGDDAGTRRTGHLLGESHGTKVCSAVVNVCGGIGGGIGVERRGWGEGWREGVGIGVERRGWG